MQLSFQTLTTLAAVMGLATPSTAYVIDVFKCSNCACNGAEINVWDNTCAGTDWFNSFRPKKFGGQHQYMTIWQAVGCQPAKYWQEIDWTDGGDGRFNIGGCHNVDGDSYWSASSYYRVGSGRTGKNATETEE